MGLILSWVLNNKMLSLCLIALIFLSVVLGFTRVALSIKSAEVKKQKVEIVELKAIQKENEANITALKQYADQMAEQKKNAEKVNIYLSNLPVKTIEVLDSEEIKSLNHCLFAYFITHKLPDACSGQGK